MSAKTATTSATAAAGTADEQARPVIVAGLGRTGVSCVRYLRAQGVPVAVTDSRAVPPGLEQLADLAQQVPMHLNGLDAGLLVNARQVVLSPGISLKDPFVRAARERGVEVVGDIELFARAVKAPVVAITGTNGKSTVTTLVGQMAKMAGRHARVGANLGEPALDLLPNNPASGAAPELFVLELSSFQLETTRSLQLKAAAVLNVSADHMDRYATLEEYAAAKARIFMHSACAVINLDDPVVARMPPPGPKLGFSVVEGRTSDFGLIKHDGELHLARHGQPLLALSKMKLTGLHNAANALAALALGEAAGLEMEPMLKVLQTFAGLPHRMQWVADRRGVRWIDDSKGTNVGATCAAIDGMTGPLVVIAGGEGKGQDFAPLTAAFRGKVRHAVLIGKDAPAVGAAIQTVCTVHRASGMTEAVVAAAGLAHAGDTVLLSPACASLDMFRDYVQRGEMFATAVKGLPA